MRSLLKAVIPNKDVYLPVLRGPFRGATIKSNPRHSIRKVLGLYEHELNYWLKRVLPLVDTVLDVGANDGYFTFGCAAAFRRLQKPGKIFAFEPQAEAFERLKSNAQKQRTSGIEIHLHNCFVGSENNSQAITLDEFAREFGDEKKLENAMIKVDVEGAEIEVIARANSWLNSKNYFLVEVHDRCFLETLTEIFNNHGVRLTQVNQRPVPLIGYERRDRENWWLVSELS